jgi:hypothetical protein
LIALRTRAGRRRRALGSRTVARALRRVVAMVEGAESGTEAVVSGALRLRGVGVISRAFRACWVLWASGAPVSSRERGVVFR